MVHSSANIAIEQPTMNTQELLGYLTLPERKPISLPEPGRDLVMSKLRKLEIKCPKELDPE